MPFLEAIGVILGIVVAVLSIVRMISGSKPPTTTIEGTYKEVSNPPHAASQPVPLSHAEFERLAASMPVEWVVFEGMTPPLKLKIRGASEAMHRYFARRHIRGIGEEVYNRMAPEQQRAITRAINAELYVLDWDDARYANGNKIPFSAPSLELMLQKDPDLDAFLSGQVKRISPIWDV